MPPVSPFTSTSAAPSPIGIGSSGSQYFKPTPTYGSSNSGFNFLGAVGNLFQHIPPGTFTSTTLGSKASQPGGVSNTPSNILSSSQTAKPQTAVGNTATPQPSSVDIGSFTPAQQQAFLNAASLAPAGSLNISGFSNPVTNPGGAVGSLLNSSGQSISTAGGSPVPAVPAGTPAPQNVGTTPNMGTASGSLGAGTPQNIASTSNNYGANIGNMIGQSQQTFQQQNQMTQQYIGDQQKIISDATRELEQLTGGSYSGTAADYSGRAAQLANLIQSATGNVNQAQANLAQFSQQAQTGLYNANALQTPGTMYGQVGQGTTVIGPGGQPVLSTPQLAPIGTQTLYPVTPSTYTGGQPNVPATPAYTVQSGDTLTNIAAKYGVPVATLEQANPQIADPNKIEVGQRINIPGAGQSSNTPFTAGQVAGQIQLGGQASQNNAAIISAQGIQQKISQDIIQNGINSLSPVNMVNAINGWIQGNLSNPAYANFYNDLTDYALTLAPLIGIAGSATDMKTAIGQSLVNGTMSGQSIIQVMDNLNQLALNKNAGVISAGQGAVPTGQPAATSNTPVEGSGTNVQTAGGMQFYKDANGIWHEGTQ